MAGTQGLRAQIRHSMHDVSVHVEKMRPAKSVTAAAAEAAAANTWRYRFNEQLEADGGILVKCNKARHTGNTMQVSDRSQPASKGRWEAGGQALNAQPAALGPASALEPACSPPSGCLLYRLDWKRWGAA